MSTRSLVILFLLSAVINVLGHTYSPEIQAGLAKIRETCKARTGASEESILSSLNGGKMAEDYEYKCYLKCTMDELGTVLNEQGEVDVEAAVANLPQELMDQGVDKLISTCGTKKGADDCETGFLTLQCYQQTNPDVFITI